VKSRFLLQTIAAFVLLLTAVVYCGRLVGLGLEGGELDLAGHSTTSLSAETRRFFADELERNLAITYLVSSRHDMPSHFKGVETQVRSLLEVLRRLAPDRVDYRVIDPQVSGDVGAAYAARRKVSPVSVRRVLRDEHDEKKIWSSLVLAYQGHPDILIQGIETTHLPHLEQLILQHLRSLTRPVQPSFAVAAPAGYEVFPQILSQNGPVVYVNMDVPRPHLPLDTDIFFWLEPGRVTAAHLRQLRRYIASGRSVILAGSAYTVEYLFDGDGSGSDASATSIRYRVHRSPPAWEQLLRPFGLRPLPDLLMDRNAGALSIAFGDKGPIEVDAPFHLRNLPAFRDFRNFRSPARGGLSFVAASALEIDPQKVSAAGFRADVVATTTEHAWVRALPEGYFDNDDLSADSPLTVPKQNLMVLLTPDDLWSGQILVAASASPFRDGIITRAGYGHAVVIKDLVRTFADPQRLVRTRVVRPQAESLPPMTDASRVFWRGFVVFLFPLLLLLVPARRLWQSSEGRSRWGALLARRGRAALRPLAVGLLLVVSLGAGLAGALRGIGPDLTADGNNTPDPTTLLRLERNRDTLTGDLVISPRAAMPTALKGVETRIISLFDRAGIALNVVRPATLTRPQLEALHADGAGPFEVERVQRDTLVAFQVWSALQLKKGDRATVVPRLDASTLEHLDFLIAAAIRRLDSGKAPMISVVSDLPRLSPAEALEDYQKKGLSAPGGVDVYSLLKELLTDYGYRLHHVNPRYPALATDSDAVLWLQPRRDSGPVIELVSAFLSRGGQTVVAMQHFNIQQRQYRGTGFKTVYWPQPQFQDLDRYLRLVGVEQVREVLMDRTRHRLTLDTQVNRTAVREYNPQEVALPFLIRSVGAHYAPDSPVTANLGDLLFIWGNRFALDSSLLAAGGFRTDVLITTSDRAWAYPWKGGWLPPEVLAPHDYLTGRQPLAVSISGPFPAAGFAENEEGRKRLVALPRSESRSAADNSEGSLLLLGSSEMFKNHRLHTPGFQHAQLLLNAVALATHGPEMARLQARHRPPRGFAFVDSTSKTWWRLFAVGAGPMAMIAYGLARHRRRRGRRPMAITGSAAGDRS
jgi:hypothetical protein